MWHLGVVGLFVKYSRLILQSYECMDRHDEASYLHVDSLIAEMHDVASYLHVICMLRAA